MSLDVFDFGGGIDRRLPRRAGQRGGRWWNAENVQPGEGGRPRRRPPLQWRFDCHRDIKGLGWGFGRLHGWHGLTSAPQEADYPGAEHFLLHRAHRAAGMLVDALFAAPYASGRMYSVLRYTDGTRHFYSPAPASREARSVTDVEVADANCPHSDVVALVANRVFAWDGTGDTLRFSGHADPTKWTGTDDAGFLPVGRESGGQGAPTAVYGWRSLLAVLFPEQVQLWNVADPDPTRHALIDVLHGTGCDLQHTCAAVEDRLVFLSPIGYRAVVAAGDASARPVIHPAFGKQMDGLVQDPARAAPGVQKAVYSQAAYAYVNLAVGARRADVYLPVGGRDAWTTYQFPAPVDNPVAAGDDLWMRNAETGAIVSMNVSRAYEADHRDETGRSVSRASDTGTADEVAAVWSGREGPAPAYRSGEAGERSTPRAASGPGETNRDPFVWWPAARVPVFPVLTFDGAYVRPGGPDAVVRLMIEYCAAGMLGADGAAVVEYHEADTGETGWKTLGILPGWAYSAEPRKGDAQTDESDGEFVFSRDGGWRLIELVKPVEARRVRIVVRSVGAVAIGAAAWGQRELADDTAYAAVQSRAVVPGRFPTNLAPIVAFCGGADGPYWYVPGDGGADVPLRRGGESAEGARQSEAHQLAAGGSWTGGAQTITVRDLAPVTTVDHLTYTVGSDGFIPAGDINFLTPAGAKWHETWAHSQSAWIDHGRTRPELMVVSGNGREFKGAAGDAPALARVRVERYDVENGRRLVPDLLFETPCRDKYEAAVGVYWLTGDVAAGKYWLAAEGSRSIQRFTRPVNPGSQPVRESQSVSYPVARPLGAGIAAADGSLYWLSFPERLLHRYLLGPGTWLGGHVSYDDALQTPSRIVFGGGRLRAWDPTQRTVRAVSVVPVAVAGSTVATADLAIRRVTALAAPGLSYASVLDLPFLSSPDVSPAVLESWMGFRVEQRGSMKVRWALHDARGRERRTREKTVRGDTSGRARRRIGVVAPEVAPEIRVDNDDPWELTALYIESRPHRVGSTL